MASVNNGYLVIIIVIVVINEWCSRATLWWVEIIGESPHEGPKSLFTSMNALLYFSHAYSPCKHRGETETPINPLLRHCCLYRSITVLWLYACTCPDVILTKCPQKVPKEWDFGRVRFPHVEYRARFTAVSVFSAWGETSLSYLENKLCIYYEPLNGIRRYSNCLGWVRLQCAYINNVYAVRMVLRPNQYY